MSLSKTVFRFLLVIVGFLTLLTMILFPLQEPGTGGYVISLVTLVVQIAFLALLALALYMDWTPLESFEEPR